MTNPTEQLARHIHSIYQAEAKRQEEAGIAPKRHHDSYDELPEHIKEFDRVIARYIETTLREQRERFDRDMAYMFANAPETYHAIKQIIYN